MDPTNTIFAEFATRIINLKDGTKVKVQLFDTAGQERYRSVVSR
jgi:GTPase SAR1 family protein